MAETDKAAVGGGTKPTETAAAKRGQNEQGERQGVIEGVKPQGDVHILTADDEVKGAFKKDSAGDLFTPEKDVYEEFVFPGTTRPAYRLVAAAGVAINSHQLAHLEERRQGQTYDRHTHGTGRVHDGRETAGLPEPPARVPNAAEDGDK